MLESDGMVAAVIGVMTSVADDADAAEPAAAGAFGTAAAEPTVANIVLAADDASDELAAAVADAEIADAALPAALASSAVLQAGSFTPNGTVLVTRDSGLTVDSCAERALLACKHTTPSSGGA